MTLAQEEFGTLPGARDDHVQLECGGDGERKCPVTDVVTRCAEATCTVRGQICIDGGFLCTGGGELRHRRPRHCPKDAPLCWVAMSFRGGEGYEDGAEIVDCGTRTPTTCARNGASPGELCADLSDVYHDWFICRATLPTHTCTAPPCWHRIDKAGGRLRVQRKFALGF